MHHIGEDKQFCGSQTRLWVDTDITIGHKSGLKPCDVDDGYALGLLLRSQEVDIVGVSSTLGNCDDIEVTTEIAQSFIQKFGPTYLSVSKGSASFFDSAVGVPKAVTDLAYQLKQEPLTILAIGALTNIALLIKHYPDVLHNIEKIVCVAGRRSTDQHFVASKHQTRPFRDLNFEVDEAAFEVLLSSDVPLTLVPFEVCADVWVNFSELRAMSHSSSLSHFLEQHSMIWWTEWKLIFGAKEGFIPFDMVAAAYVVNPEWFVSHSWEAKVEIAASDTDKHKEKAYLVCNESIEQGREVDYVVEVSPDAEPEMLKRLAERDIGAFVLGLSHINVIVDDVDTAADYYQRVLGFERALDAQRQKMDYRGVSMTEFNQDAGLAGQDVVVDVLFVKHPYASVYLELMKYHTPIGTKDIPPQPKTYDLGGPRHVALEVSNCGEVFRYLKQQEGVTMINTSDEYHPEKLDGFPISFFYWIDKYGIQWEMEEGRRVGTSRGIV
jgi:inosine-uridine nucleoside N-ribohydrolase/catechol 2,3-dioxygenase-like lactoylglutathione lyase family enzyme